MIDISIENKSKLAVSYDSAGDEFSYYSDDRWLFLDLDINVSFSKLSGRFKEVAKEIVVILINKRTLKSKKSMVKNTIEGAVILEKCIVEVGGYSYECLDDDRRYRDFLDEAKKTRRSFKTWKNDLMFFEKLCDSGYLKRTIDSYDVLAENLAGGTGVRQSMAIPECIAKEYYSKAIEIVEQYYKDRYLISLEYEEFYLEYFKNETLKKSDKETGFQGSTKVNSTLNIEFDLGGSWLSWLRGACYVVIAAFTGCRDGEIKSFDLDSYEEKEYQDFIISIVNGKTTKQNPGGVPRVESWVTIPAVKKAIELVWCSYDFSRVKWIEKAKNENHPDLRKILISNANSLFLNNFYTTSKYSNAGRQSLSKSIKNFCKSLNYEATLDDVKEFNLLNPTRINELKLGGVLIPHPHGFRRTLAVFIVRNRLTSLLGVKYQLKHAHVVISAWYSNNADIASYIDMMSDQSFKLEIAEEREGYMTDSLYEIYNESETLSGAEGHRIMKLKSESGTNIYYSRDEILEQVRDGRLSIVEHPMGHCTNPSCNRICDNIPCQYKVITKEKALEIIPVRNKLIKKLTELYESGVKQPNIMSRMLYEIKSHEKVLDDHGILVEKFNVDISVGVL